MWLKNLNFKWAWGAQSLSHTHKNLENYSFYIDEQIVLLPILSITNQKLENLEKPIFSLNSRPLTVEFEGFSTVSGLEQREKKSVFLNLPTFGKKYEEMIVLSFVHLLFS